MAVWNIHKKIYDLINSVIATARVKVTTQSPMPITDNAGSITVDAVNFDVRDFSSATDSIACVQSGAWNVTIQEPLTIDQVNPTNLKVGIYGHDYVSTLYHMKIDNEGKQYIASIDDANITIDRHTASTQVWDDYSVSGGGIVYSSSVNITDYKGVLVCFSNSGNFYSQTRLTLQVSDNDSDWYEFDNLGGVALNAGSRVWDFTDNIGKYLRFKLDKEAGQPNMILNGTFIYHK